MVLVLASSSPRRAVLLDQLGIEPAIRPADIDEAPLPGEVPTEYVERIARDKCGHVANAARPHDVVLAADTTVALRGQIMGKPADRAELVRFLERLSGTSHDVFTAVAVASAGRMVSAVEHTAVEFVELSDADIDWYASLDEPYDKAGGYGVQGAGGLFVRAIHGSPDNVVGLPRALAANLFRELGLRLTDYASEPSSPGTGTMDP